MTVDNHHIGIIIMAAGASRRLGQPKQLIHAHGQSLLAGTAQVALATDIRPVIVVLGAHADAIEPTIPREEVTCVHNTHWQEGMASSLRMGLRTILQSNPCIEAAILMVCDQPYVHAGLLLQLQQRHLETGLPAIACSYAGRVGTPALFHRSIFKELLLLEGDSGARKWLADHPERVGTLPFEKGALDIDTPEDLAQWLKHFNTDLS